jgi:hypothetical protein
LLSAVAAFGQYRGVYGYQKVSALTAAAETVTIFLPTTQPGRQVLFVGATVYCSVACTFTVERDGTTPTATAGTAVELNGGMAATAIPYHTSNVSTTTTIKNYDVTPTQELSIDLLDKSLVPGKSLTIRTNAITGTVRIYIHWRER